MATQVLPQPEVGGVSLADLDPGLRFQNRGRNLVYICSIYPRESKSVQPFMYKMPDGRVGFLRTYMLEAVPKGAKPYVLPIATTLTLVMQETDHPSGERCMGQTPKPVYASTIADSLIQLWVRDSTHYNHDAHPGIGIIDGEEPTEEELQTLRREQANYFQSIIHAGSQLWFSKDPDQVRMLRPGSLYRTAADYMGADVEWARDYATTLSKRCIACGELIHEKARACKHCNRNLLAWPFDSGMTMEDLQLADPFIAAQPTVLKRYESAAAKQSKPKTIGDAAKLATRGASPVQPPMESKEY